MNQAERFLTGFAQALSTFSLYELDHPLRQRVLDQGFLNLQDLCDRRADPVFTFLDDDVLFDGRPLRTLRAWMWAQRLSEAGVQRIEVMGPPSRGSYGAFVEEIHRRLQGEGQEEDGVRCVEGFSFGAVGISASDPVPTSSGEGTPVAALPQAMDFLDEAGALEWVLGEVKGGRELQMLEVELIVKGLGAAMRGAVDFLIPVLRLEDYDAYTTVHSLNVSILTMAFGEFLGLERKQIQLLGIGGILHDLGKITIPDEVLEKETDLTEAEWDLIREHPVDGARIILESDDRLELPAIMAYEHHMAYGGGGYPKPVKPRSCHPLSHVTQLCDVYDTLGAPRPYRGPLARVKILEVLEKGAGTTFDPHLTRGFCQMIREWDGRMQVFEDRNEDPRSSESLV